MPNGFDIYKVGDGNYAEAAKDFIKQMDALMKAAKKDPAAYTRAEGAQNIANEYKTKGMKFFAWGAGAGFQGLAGLLILSEQADSLKVEDICTHPLSKGVGFLLIKRAILESQKLGKGGVLTLTDMSGSNFYDRLGFRRYVEGDELKKRLAQADATALMKA